MTTTLLIGTTKGAFLIDSQDRATWTVRGPFCDGWPINHVIGDPDTGTLWAAGGGNFFGAGVFRSDDHGDTWTLTKLCRGQLDDMAEQDPDFAAFIGWVDTPAPFAQDFSQVWSLAYAHGTLYAGTQGAQLLTSGDGGATFARVDALADHPSRESWSPGGVGLILHTIVPDPDEARKLWLGISAAGVFATEDGGVTWERRNRVSNRSGAHDADSGGEVGHCVHNMVRAAGNSDLLYQQNHQGVWRSPDGGRSWDDITAGLPSTFGFPMAVHPGDAQTIWTLPLNGDTDGRFPPGAAAAVWKSTDGGASWSDRRAGLPQTACFFTVLRQAMATDRAATTGVYFGTNSGSVFASTDEGDTWDEIARHLPTVLSVETLDKSG